MTKTIIPIEDVECQVFHNWLEFNHIPHHHIANESKLGASDPKLRRLMIARMKKLIGMGLSKGYWDYAVYIPIKGVAGTVDAYEKVMIEMKRQKGGVLSPEQKQWQAVYEKAGERCKVCKGAEEAIKFIENIKKEIENDN